MKVRGTTVDLPTAILALAAAVGGIGNAVQWNKGNVVKTDLIATSTAQDICCPMARAYSKSECFPK